MNSKKFLVLFFAAYLVPIVNVFAQQLFQRGYFITNEGERVDCAIKNVKWRNNPETFVYKLERETETRTADLENIKEFGVGKEFVFVRQIVDVDQSSSNVISVSKQRNPEFKTEIAFLRLIVAGRANLYQYRKEGYTLFFYNKGEQPLEPLVYKIYRSVNSASVIKENERFKQQLTTGLRCLSPELKGFENLSYNRQDLEKVFIRYNNCAEYPTEEVTNSSVKTFEKLASSTGEEDELVDEYYKNVKSAGPVSLSLKPRLVFSQLNFENEANFLNFKGNLGVRPGLEVAYNRLSRDQRLSLFGEVVWQRLNLGGFSIVNGERQKIDYLELPLGLRYQFSLPQSGGSFFINAAFLGVVTLTNVESSGANTVTEPGPSLAFGVGFRSGGRFSLELRKTLNRRVEVANFNSDKITYSLFSFVAGYRIL